MLRTDAVAYAASREQFPNGAQLFRFRAVLTLENRGQRALELGTCDGERVIYDVERVDAAATPFRPVWACPAHEPLQLAPGAVRTDTVEVIGSSFVSPGLGLPRVAGAHRIVYLSSAGPIRSQPFEVSLDE